MRKIDVSKFRSLFSSTFKKLPVPVGSEIVLLKGDIDTKNEIAEAFSNRSWTELTVEFIAAYDDAISFMQPSAKRYYLPAYLLAALQAPEDSFFPSMIIDELFLPMYRPRSRNIRTKFQEFVKLLTEEEKDAIKQFLQHTAQNHPSYSARWEAALALRVFWAKA